MGEILAYFQLASGGMQVPGYHYLRLRFSVACLLFCALFALSARADLLTCDVCGKTILTDFYWINSKLDGKKYRVCKECEAIQGRCYICGLPAVDGSEKLADGRFICPRELKTIVESETEAKEICGTVHNDLDRLFSRWMTFPDEDVSIAIVDQYRLEDLFHAPGSESSCVSVYGATSTHPLPNHKFIHTVNLLSNMQKSRLMAVCAHERTHTWMGENVSRQRQMNMDKDTLEAFCELVAYKYMDSLHDEEQMAIIKRNTYTHGQIMVLIEADNKYGFNTVVDWVQNGEDNTVTMDNLDRIRAVTDHAASPIARTTSAPALIYGTAPVAAPTTLMLKSISGSPQRRFALINSTTFETNEKEHVRVGTNNFSVRCLEIHADSVVIQVDGSTEKKQLFLRAQ